MRIVFEGHLQNTTEPGVWWHVLRIPYKCLAFSVVRLLILPANVYDLKVLMGANQYEFEVFSETGVMTQWLKALADLQPGTVPVTHMIPHSHL